MKGSRSSSCGAPGGPQASASMTNHHGWGLVKQVSDTLHPWRDRVRQRRELAQWTDRDLHDVGLSWSDIALEVKKPFWRA
jgi:uncharacterized protein YjiS (DUF1127 family)